MKQIEKVSIGGYVFTLDTEAAAETDRYLKEMSAYYTNPEITDGIEERMAELLRERTGEDGVVGKNTILSIIDILGRPERIAQDEPDDAAPGKAEKPAKKLYRDMENAKLAGVCSGLSAYFNIDPAIPRIAFVVFTLLGIFLPWEWHVRDVTSFFGPVLYVILWICMPAARTVQQRWQMRGDDGTAESIRRNIESGAAEVGSALRQVGNAPAWGTLGRILEVAIGIFLLIVAVSGLFAGGLAVFGWQWLHGHNQGRNDRDYQRVPAGCSHHRYSVGTDSRARSLRTAVRGHALRQHNAAIPHKIAQLAPRTCGFHRMDDYRNRVLHPHSCNGSFRNHHGMTLFGTKVVVKTALCL